MYRLIGRRYEAGELSESPFFDRAAIVTRLACLTGAFICCVIVASSTHSLQDGESCLISYSFASDSYPPLEFGELWPCKFVFIIASMSAAFTGFFAILCLRNLCTNKIKYVKKVQVINQ